jgi:surface antigen
VARNEETTVTVIMNSRRAVGRLTGVVVIAAGVSLAVSAPAQAASRDGVCDSGEFCLYYNSGNAGAVSDHTSSLADYGAAQPACYEFKGSGAGRGQCVKNNAASVLNRTSRTVRVYSTANYGGSYQDIAPGASANLNATLKNRNASHQLTAVSYPAKDDYPYRGQTSGVDPWNFYKSQCTSFATWTLRSRVGVAFDNAYKGVRWGNAQNWNNAALSVGVPVSSKPRAGDVAVREGGTSGHVAFVTKVNSTGTVEVDEYNYSAKYSYSHRTVSVGTANSQFSSFIHFR